MTDLRHHTSFLLGDWTVFPRQHRLQKAEQDYRLSPKYMQVLIVLCEHAGETVTRDELLDAVWGDTVVGESVLTRAISEIRKKLDEDAGAPSVIETIPTLGYRLLWPVSDGPVGEAGTETGDAGTEVSPATPQVGSTIPGSARSFNRWVIPVAMAVVALSVWLMWPDTPDSTSPDATALRMVPVTSLSGEEFHPDLDASGTRVVFARTAELNGDSDIYIAPLDGSTAALLVGGASEETSPVWSPDGQFVAYVRCDPQTGRASVMSKPIGVEGSGQSVLDMDLPHCMLAPRIDWSPDGNRIALDTQLPDGRTAIHVLQLSTGRVTRFSNPPAGFEDHYPRFAPDGGRIAFQRGRSQIDSGVDLLVQARPEDEPFQLTDADMEASGFSWNGTGNALVAAAQGSLWLVDAMLGGKTWLASPGIDIVDPVVNPINGTVLFVQSLYDVNIWSVDVTDQADLGHPAIASTRVDNDPRISPDGSRLAFISDRAGQCAVWVSDKDGGNEVALATFDINCFDIRTPRWSPDGRFLAFEAGVDGNWDVFVVSTGGGAPQRVTEGPSREWSPGWSADGQRIYFSSDREGEKYLFSVPRDGGEPRRETTVLASIGRESVDGRYLLFVRPDEGGIWRIPAGQPEAEPELVIPDLGADDFRSWRVDGTSLTYLRRSANPEMVRFDLDTGGESVALVLPAPLVDCNVADLSPDGTLAVFAQVDRDEDDLVRLDGLDVHSYSR